MLQSIEVLLGRLTPAERCLVAIGLSLLFFMGYGPMCLYVLLTPTARAAVHVAVVWKMQAALLAGVLTLLAVATWLWPRRHSPDPVPRVAMVVTNTIGVSVGVVMQMLGPFTAPVNLLVIGVLAIGLVLFDRRTMLMSFGLFVVMFCGYDVLVLLGRADYAPALSPQAYVDGVPVSWWAFTRHGSFYVGMTVCTSVMFLLFGGIERIDAQLERLSATDTLTGLSNRRHFMECLQSELTAHGRQTRPVCVALLDADHFKRVNDSHGHHAGDMVLRKLATLLSENLRTPSDLAARLGGEEFALLLPDTPLTSALAVCERLRGCLANHEFKVDGQSIRVTVSIGLVEYAAGDVEAVIQQADRNLYQAKQEGRNRVISSPLAPEVFA
jgi:diguanylate cyclase (GGDEF)-like protein